MHPILPTILAALLLLLPACHSSLAYREGIRASIGPPDTEATVVIPADFIDGWMMVDAIINGHGPFRLIVDTGADFGALSPAAAAAAGLEVTQTAGVKDIAGITHEYGFAFSESTQIGPLAVKNLAFIISDNLDSMAAALDEKGLVGILGIDALDHATIDIDYPNSILRLSTQPITANEPGLTAARVERGGSPDIRIELHGPNGQIDTAWFGLDSGGNALLSLTPGLSETWAHTDVAQPGETSTGLSGTRRNLKIAPVTGDLSIGDTRIAGVLADIDSETQIIGHQLLRQFRVRYDRRSRLAALTPPGPSNTLTAMTYGGIGLGPPFRTDGTFLVFSINPDSPAARAGLRPGDTIIAVDAVPVPDLPKTFSFTTLDPPPEQTLTVQRGDETFELTIPTEPLFPEDLDRLRNRRPNLTLPTIEFTPATPAPDA